MDQPGYRQAIFQFLVFDAVSPYQGNPCLRHLVQPSFQNPAQDGKLHVLDREGHQVHGCNGPPPHGIHVAQGVRRCDLSKPVGIVHNGGKKINRLDKGYLIRDLIDPRIIQIVQTNKDVFILWKRQTTQCLLQVPRRQLGGSPRSGHGFCQS